MHGVSFFPFVSVRILQAQVFYSHCSYRTNSVKTMNETAGYFCKPYSLTVDSDYSASDYMS